ncbi:hypothetical protein PSAB6_100009 [Paraburkholderia sabiae]|nr:hypothetical protein PSAB6_100009 [Paraburkholderia sabiae]
MPIARRFPDSGGAVVEGMGVNVPYMRTCAPNQHSLFTAKLSQIARLFTGMEFALNRPDRDPIAVVQQTIQETCHAVDDARLHRSAFRFRNHDVYRHPLTSR